MANVNRVPTRQWAKWSERSRDIFNQTYTFLLHNQRVITHPAMPPAKPFHWKTIAWNAAWIAADAAKNAIPTEIVELDPRGREVRRYKVRAA